MSDNRPRLPKMPGQSSRPTRPRASLVAAAAASKPPAQQPLFDDPDADEPMEDSKEDTKEDTREPQPQPQTQPRSQHPRPTSSTPAPSAPAPSASTSQVQGARKEPVKMKFKPKMPIRRAVQEDVKPDVSASSSSSTRVARGGLRGRGRGGARGGGRGGATSVSTVAAGPFGGNRAAARRVVAPPPPSRGLETVAVEVYSDNEDGTRTGVIDIDAVSGLSESAPTSVYRARDLDGGKAAAKASAKAKIKEQKERRRRQTAVRSAVLGADAPPAGDAAVKPEPVSPARADAVLPSVREGDSMLPSDAQQDRDEAGRRVRAETSLSTVSGTPDVNEALAVDLSESEDEEYEEDLAGDFVFTPGGEHPEDKLFTFQFPHMFPRFKPPPPPAGEAEAVPDEEEKKPKPALRGAAARKAAPPPTGRIGNLVVMKSGKVKMVMGSGDGAVVMDVNPGVSTTFLQQLVHVDPKAKALTVAGEVHKSYVVTPDVDRLLDELFINGGETPGDREKRQMRQVKLERGVKMELD